MAFTVAILRMRSRPKTEHKTGSKGFTSGRFYQPEGVKKNLTKAHIQLPEFSWYILEIRNLTWIKLL